uniref:Uncharacterized protein n=1 Tax=Lepeophtheirus salmonis TaxID=72036 RepID=A0A0K2UXP1_LEPSM
MDGNDMSYLLRIYLS